MIAIIRYIKTFTIRTIILVISVLFTISIIRATIVIGGIRSAARNQPYNQTLMASWRRSFPVLQEPIEKFAPEVLHLSISPRSETETMVMLLPDLCVNFALSAAPHLWYPETTQPQEVVIIDRAPRTTPPSAHDVRPTDRTAPSGPATRTPPGEPHPGTGSTTTTPATQPDTTSLPVQTGDDQVPLDSSAMWAAVISPDAPLFDANGRRLEKTVPAGSVLQITTHRTTDNGTIYGGTIFSPAGRFDLVVLREQDLRIYRGKDLQDTTQEERERASERARILGAIAQRKEELRNGQSSNNPHQEEYRAALRRYQQLRQEGEPLQQRYEKATGRERMEAGNRLREIAQEQRLLTPQIRQLQQQRDDWNARNPQQQSRDPEQDETIISLRRELAAIPDQF
jgi:hypothetical protein